MELKITFEGERIALPIAAFSTLQGLIYHALREDPAYSERMHERGTPYEKRKFKLFTFGELRGRYEIADRKIIFLKEADFSVRAMDPYFIQILFSYFNQNKTVSLGGQSVKVARLQITQERIYTGELEIQTRSPITAYVTEENGHTRYYTPQEEAFYRSIEENARRKWSGYHGDDQGFAFEIAPAEGAVFKKCATRFKETFITAWHGRFILKAPPQVLDFLYQTGLGSKNSQGFGMFDVIDKGGKIRG